MKESMKKSGRRIASFALALGLTALIWSDPVNPCMAVGVFCFRTQGQQQPETE